MGKIKYRIFSFRYIDIATLLYGIGMTLYMSDYMMIKANNRAARVSSSIKKEVQKITSLYMQPLKPRKHL